MLSGTLSQLARSADPSSQDFSPTDSARLRSELREQWTEQRQSLLDSAASGQLASEEATHRLQLMSVLVQFANHLSKANLAVGETAPAENNLAPEPDPA